MDQNPNSHGLYTWIDTPSDDLWVFQSKTSGHVEKLGATGNVGRLILGYHARPRVLQQFFQYCAQADVEVPLLGEWQRKFYSAPFTAFPESDEHREDDLRKACVQRNTVLPVADGRPLHELVEEAHVKADWPVIPFLNFGQETRSVYPLIVGRDLSYVQTSDHGRTHEQILIFDPSDVPYMVERLSRDCRKRGHGNIPGWFFKDAEARMAAK